MRRAKSLRIGVHHADAVVWEPVCRTHLRTNVTIGGASEASSASQSASSAALVARVNTVEEEEEEEEERPRFFAKPRRERLRSLLVVVVVPSEGHSIQAKVGVEFKGVEGGD